MPITIVKSSSYHHAHHNPHKRKQKRKISKLTLTQNLQEQSSANSSVFIIQFLALVALAALGTIIFFECNFNNCRFDFKKHEWIGRDSTNHFRLEDSNRPRPGILFWAMREKKLWVS